MKNLYTLMIALACLALPAATFGQVTVNCADCTHQLSVYMGEGGFVVEAEDADEKIAWVSTCEGVTVSGEMDADATGKFAHLLTNANGLACNGTSEKNKFELANVKDGGWFWVNDDMNSAVGNIVAQDVLDNDTTTITSAGDGVTMTKGTGAVFLKETATGRVGILSNILPMPEMDPVPVNYCDTTGAGKAGDAWKRETTNCMLKDGSTVVRAQGQADTYTGKKATIASGSMVTRPASGSVSITYDLWSAGGQYATTASEADHGKGNRLGHTGGNPLSASFSATATTGGPGSISDLSNAGLAISEAESVGTLTITPKSEYCSKDNNHSVTVTVLATATSPDQLTPPIKDTNSRVDGTQAASHKVTVSCPAASAYLGVDLVPENPFPVD